MFKSKANSKLLTKLEVERLFSPGNLWHGKKEILGSDLAMYNEIDVGAFQDQKQLLKVEIPNNITKIGNGAFIDCLRLKTVVLPDSIKSFGLAVFGGCFSLKKINIPANFSYIPTATFADCSLLEEIEIHDNIKKIGTRAFANCLSLKTIYIPRSVEVIKENAFANCPSLEKGIFNSSFYFQAHHFGLFEEQFNTLHTNLKSKMSSEFLFEKKLISKDDFNQISEKIKVVKFKPISVVIQVPKALLSDKKEAQNTTNSEESNHSSSISSLMVNKKSTSKKDELPRIPETQKHTIVPLEEFLNNYNYNQRRKDWHVKAGHNDKQLVCWKCKDDDNWETILLDNGEHVCYYCWIKKPDKKVETKPKAKPFSALVVTKKNNTAKPETKPAKVKKVNGIEVTKKHIVMKKSDLETYDYGKRRKQWHKNAGYIEKVITCSVCKEKKHTSVVTEDDKHICYNCFIKKPAGNKKMVNPKNIKV